ncbi:hypothetical protein MBM09_01640 [Flaviramulus sp. BrNp1-15]|uniref:hypothetical protein n=1 Tax=Flaviramulus sp. BrNp1-15 TaxID=2916754 RepID=UPI001EE872EE|nr:hypothetical protein [Flaviramulus sp. BrNp1-15]ULC59691.1 hypothetical protein MBM09_01640 [Flaviramulus sp. BrNp1-15]
MSFIMLKCQNCELTFPYNPISIEFEKQTQELPIRTPIPGSHGFISLVNNDNENFYGCGETGTIWKRQKNLFRDIEQIIKKYPHRELCYLKTKDGWIANPNEPNDMDKLIEQETFERLTKFEMD